MRITKVFVGVLFTFLHPIGSINIKNVVQKQKQLVQTNEIAQDVFGIVDDVDNYTNNVASDFQVNTNTQPPIIVYGGMGSTCDEDHYLKILQMLRNQTGAYVGCFSTDAFGSIQGQSEEACTELQQDSNFNTAEEFNIFGISQGGLIGRYILEDCQLANSSVSTLQPKVRNLLNVGTPNMGISAIPSDYCDPDDQDVDSAMLCLIANYEIEQNVYDLSVQSMVSSAGYFVEEDDQESAVSNKTFLSKLNNQVCEGGPQICEQHKNAIKSLHGYMMVQFDQDEIIAPIQSELFGNVTVDEAGESVYLPMEQSEIYLDDTLGLRYLDEQGRLFQEHINNTHTQFSDEDFTTLFLPFIMS